MAELSPLTRITMTLSQRDFDIIFGWKARAFQVLVFMLILGIIVTLCSLISRQKHFTYDMIAGRKIKWPPDIKEVLMTLVKCCSLLLSIFFALMYLYWRIAYSVPWEHGFFAIFANIILLLVEIFGFVEALNLYRHFLSMKNRPVPEITEEEYPEVDIFIPTCDESAEMLEKTINGCNHLNYPDISKVHIWLCDDSCRPEMKELADKMKVGYLDHPDSDGTKAGNLNAALARTTAPYVVLLNADMLVRSDFLLKTVPYFIDIEKKNEKRPEKKRAPLGLLQTALSFYEPDIFQHALYSENNAPNEQDFFYRTIEVSKTATNSVIFCGSNAVISRKALETVGGFYTGSATEAFATGLLIESSGFVSLATPEPLASGRTPDTFPEHIRRKLHRNRGVFKAAEKLRLFTRKGLTPGQRLSYLNSVIYWYSPIKSFLYVMAPLIFAMFAVPVFKCSWADLLMLWLPMFVLKEVTLRLFSGNSVSHKWIGIYETSIMPYLVITFVKEKLGMATGGSEIYDKHKKSMIPFLVLIVLSLAGITSSLLHLKSLESIGIVILMFWLVRNLYFLIMSIFLVDGRDGDYEEVRVKDAEPLILKDTETGSLISEGITTYLTEHSLGTFLDDNPKLPIGKHVDITIETMNTKADLECIITGFQPSRSGSSCVYRMEILDYKMDRYEYLQILYDRIPTLPQTLSKDYGVISHLLRNIAHRILR